MNKFSKTQQMLFSLIGDPKINKKLKKNLMESLDTKNIDLICEFVLNVFNKNVPMCNDSYKSLKPQAKYCRKLLNKKLNLKEKKKILIKKGIQTGGFLQFIIPAVISALGGIVSSLITKKE
jgi:hypothetical protein